jgi:hypothetical protein
VCRQNATVSPAIASPTSTRPTITHRSAALADTPLAACSGSPAATLLGPAMSSSGAVVGAASVGIVVAPPAPPDAPPARRVVVRARVVADLAVDRGDTNVSDVRVRDDGGVSSVVGGSTGSDVLDAFGRVVGRCSGSASARIQLDSTATANVSTEASRIATRVRDNDGKDGRGLGIGAQDRHPRGGAPKQAA